MKLHISNNKKNNNECSNLLRLAINTEKKLLIKPYPKEKQIIKWKKNNKFSLSNTKNIAKKIISLGKIILV